MEKGFEWIILLRGTTDKLLFSGKGIAYFPSENHEIFILTLANEGHKLLLWICLKGMEGEIVSLNAQGRRLSENWSCATLWWSFDKHCHIWSWWEVCSSEQQAAGLWMAFSVYTMCLVWKCQQELGREGRSSVVFRSSLENGKCCQKCFLWFLCKSLTYLDVCVSIKTWESFHSSWNSKIWMKNFQHMEERKPNV